MDNSTVPLSPFSLGIHVFLITTHQCCCALICSLNSGGPLANRQKHAGNAVIQTCPPFSLWIGFASFISPKTIYAVQDCAEESVRSADLFTPNVVGSPGTSSASQVCMFACTFMHTAMFLLAFAYLGQRHKKLVIREYGNAPAESLMCSCKHIYAHACTHTKYAKHTHTCAGNVWVLHYSSRRGYSDVFSNFCNACRSIHVCWCCSKSR